MKTDCKCVCVYVCVYIYIYIHTYIYIYIYSKEAALHEAVDLDVVLAREVGHLEQFGSPRPSSTPAISDVCRRRFRCFLTACHKDISSLAVLVACREEAETKCPLLLTALTIETEHDLILPACRKPSLETFLQADM